MNRALILSCVLGGWLLSALAAPPPGAPNSAVPRVAARPLAPSPDGSRFLFVVDTSYSMSRLDKPSRQVVFDLIVSGLASQMRAGDTYGLWTFNEEPHTGNFPMQVWDPKRVLELGSNAGKFLRSQRYRGQTRMDLVLAKTFSVIKNVRDVNVFIISDGDTAVKGTPCDDEINLTYAQNASRARKAKTPFITTLVARDGQIIRAFVTFPGERIVLPARPTPGKTAKVAEKPSDAVAEKTKSTESSTNAPAAATTAAGSKEAPAVTNAASVNPPAVNVVPTSPTAVVQSNAPAPPPQKVIVIKTVTNVAPAQPTQTAQATVNPTTPAEKPDLPKATAVSLPSGPPSPPPTDSATVPLRASEPTSPKTLASSPGPSEKPAAPPALAPNPTPVAARENAASTSSPEVKLEPTVALAATSVPRERSLSAWALFMIGGGLLALVFGVVVICVWRLRPSAQPSSITRSMDRR